MKRLSIGLVALAAFVAFSGVPVVASAAAGSVKCEITKDGKKEVKHLKTSAECTKMGGKVVTTPKHATAPKPKTN
jgi:hypothetical protein